MNDYRLILRFSYNKIFLSFLRFFYDSIEQVQQISNIFDLISFVIQKMTMLSKVLRNRSLSVIHCQVIAIDEFESQVVEVLIEYLYESFKTRISHFIRLCSTIFVETMNSNFQNYNRVITH